jgi:hypothetical protein
VDLGVEQGEADPVGGEHVGVGARQALDEPLAAQPGQVIAHLRGRVGSGQQGRHPGAKAPMGEPDHAGECAAEGAGQGHDPGIAEAQGSGAASRLARWLCDPRKGWARKDTALTGPFSVQQTAVGCTCLGLQLVQVAKAAADAQVARPGWSAATGAAAAG